MGPNFPRLRAACSGMGILYSQNRESGHFRPRADAECEGAHILAWDYRATLMRAAARGVARVAKTRLHHRSQCSHRLRTPLGVCLSLALSLCAAFAQGEPIPSAQSREVNVDKPAHFQVWRTITLGSYKGVDAYRNALDIAKIKIGDSADEILGRPAFPYARAKTGVELAVLSAADLGVESDRASLAEVYQRARQAGLELCPAEVGPQLRLDYRNQPLGEALDIAMEPVATYGGEPTILTLANWGTGLLLIGRDGRPESTVFRKSRFVFALPTNERLEAMSEPQVVPTSSELTNQAPKGGL
jgi:hypothetical protein